jgi:hypothetical protein
MEHLILPFDVLYLSPLTFDFQRCHRPVSRLKCSSMLPVRTRLDSHWSYTVGVLRCLGQLRQVELDVIVWIHVAFLPKTKVYITNIV